MSVAIDKIWLFRIVHIDNVEHLLQHGMFTRNHINADPDYINIGDTNLIAQRNDYPVGLTGFGNLGDYVPFYFGPLSPMLLNIKTGYRGIQMRPQSEIVYICCKLDQIVRECPIWCFTDGHAKNAFTDFYSNLNDLKYVDFKTTELKYFNNTADDQDRMRKKQAEFLVKNSVSASCVASIVVYNEEKKDIIQNIIDSLGLSISVHVNPKNNFYF